MTALQQNIHNPNVRSFKIIELASEPNKVTNARKYTTVSLFCGAGGLDLGFEQAGFATLWANDFDSDACKTHRMWSNANVVCGDISKIDSASIPDSDIILGGFPCQGFSLSGPRKIDDARNRLYREYVRIVKAKKPAIFVGENVKGGQHYG
jgi:DNA (cytosine-5)-methyltransferase 1